MRREMVLRDARNKRAIQALGRVASEKHGSPEKEFTHSVCAERRMGHADNGAARSAGVYPQDNLNGSVQTFNRGGR